MITKILTAFACIMTLFATCYCAYVAVAIGSAAQLLVALAMLWLFFVNLNNFFTLPTGGIDNANT